jgi:hypothetical protein
MCRDEDREAVQSLLRGVSEALTKLDRDSELLDPFQGMQASLVNLLQEGRERRVLPRLARKRSEDARPR